MLKSQILSLTLASSLIASSVTFAAPTGMPKPVLGSSATQIEATAYHRVYHHYYRRHYHHHYYHRRHSHESPHFCVTLKSPNFGFPQAAGRRIIWQGEPCARRRSDLISFRNF